MRELAALAKAACRRNRGHCMGMVAAGYVFMRVPAVDAEGTVFGAFGIALAVVGGLLTMIALSKPEGQPCR